MTNRRTRKVPVEAATELRSLIANIIFMPRNKAGNPIRLDSQHRASKATCEEIIESLSLSVAGIRMYALLAFIRVL